MLRIAIPNKGSLSEGAMELMREAGYRCRRDDRELIARDRQNDIEFVFLRPRDIAVYVANGVVELGITGRDLAIDSRAEVEELLPLKFGGSRFFYAIPRDKDLTPDDFEGYRIATSYPVLVEEDMKKRGVNATIVRLDGAVEISIQLGVADAIADVVQSGKTLEQAGLKVIDKPILVSEAILISRDKKAAEQTGVRTMIERLEGVVVAREYALVEYDIPRTNLEQACKLTPGIESPTVSDLAEKDWAAVRAMHLQKELHKTMDELKKLGAKGIIVTDIRSCRL